MILHKFSVSPFSNTNLENALSRIDANDGILLMQDAVYALNSAPICEQLSQRTKNLHALEPDCIARGIQCNEFPILMIDYNSFVALTLDYDNLISW
ncbi:sulfurtransferase complex subunit TusB [Aliiglaciecola sp. NS0011-25]|uniref:sulfurtransferase complex subunit TusB n=1 Tax=Aliiglaciecola sp. NS0011-25 TaxID=3127654 RepID=UPI00310A6454